MLGQSTVSWPGTAVGVCEMFHRKSRLFGDEPLSALRRPNLLGENKTDAREEQALEPHGS